jgi:hypothetical protein
MTVNSDSLYLNNNLIERVNQFTYLGSIIDESGGTYWCSDQDTEIMHGIQSTT